jgi:hypothetical protein
MGAAQQAKQPRGRVVLGSPGPTSVMAGARMNSARKVPPFCAASGSSAGEGSSVSKLLSCAPKKLRWTRQSSPPSNAWPPDLVPAERAWRAVGRRRAGLARPHTCGPRRACKLVWGGALLHDPPLSTQASPPPAGGRCTASCEVPDCDTAGAAVRVPCCCGPSSPVARSARKISPAQVPHTGLPWRANCCSSGMRPQRSATSAIVVLSPPAHIAAVRRPSRPSGARQSHKVRVGMRGTVPMVAAA